ncbi:hypothetical protein [Streptomyces sp. NPDC093089]|uniref:hypothetical protein n=1 Tax=Streptomyces sp. NPDC093089 TaxID=3366024 RepID=UPI00380DB956
MEQRVRVHEVRFGDGEIRVVRPEPVPERLVLRDDGHWLSMYVDREGAERLTALWALAARSARSLIHLPIRANRAPDAVGGDGVPVALDLVLAHHSLRFPAASWKGVRARLGAGRPRTGATPDADFPDPGTVDHGRRYHPTFRDHLGFDIAAHTLFVVGSATAFREYGAELRGLVDEAPSHGHRNPGARHYCVELTSGPWSRPRSRRNVPGALHIQYCDTWRD